MRQCSRLVSLQLGSERFGHSIADTYFFRSDFVKVFPFDTVECFAVVNRTEVALNIELVGYFNDLSGIRLCFLVPLHEPCLLVLAF